MRNVIRTILRRPRPPSPAEPPADPVDVARAARLIFLSVGILYALIGAAFLLGRAFPFLEDVLAEQSASRVLPTHVDLAWALLYLIGGTLVTVGVQRRDLLLERPGHLLLLTAVVVNVAAIFDVRAGAALSVLPAQAAVVVLLALRLGYVRGLINAAVARQPPLALAVVPVIAVLSIDLGQVLTGGMVGGILVALLNYLGNRGVNRSKEWQDVTTAQRESAKADRERLGDAHVRIEALEQKNDDLHADNEDLHDKLRESERREQKLQREVDGLRGELRDSQREVGELRGRIEEFAAALARRGVGVRHEPRDDGGDRPAR